MYLLARPIAYKELKPVGDSYEHVNFNSNEY